MSYLNFKSEYDRFPKTKIKGHKAFCGYEEIYHELNKTGESTIVWLTSPLFTGISSSFK